MIDPTIEKVEPSSEKELPGTDPNKENEGVLKLPDGTSISLQDLERNRLLAGFMMDICPTSGEGRVLPGVPPVFLPKYLESSSDEPRPL